MHPTANGPESRNGGSVSGAPYAAPRLVFWEATAGCNLECRHCRRLEVAKALSKRDLTTEQAEHCLIDGLAAVGRPVLVRSEEHTSELQSQSNLLCRLPL